MKKIVAIFFLFVSICGCTRDDICPEDTATTPLLIITFNDIASPTMRKAVTGLIVRTTGNTPTQLVIPVANDSIALPLRTGDNSTSYELLFNGDTDDEISEIYAFNYTRDDIYVNRACGFKTIYNDLGTNEEDTNTVDWILDVTINKQTIEDETSAHITFFH